MSTIFWHDYETFGADPQKDRPSQFAGVRTDLDLNIIEEPITIFCQPAEDFLPSPEACLVTGITPQHAYSEGIKEHQFAREIHEIFSVPGTCVAGYNSIRFDDEVTRNLFYRNFYDPYEREWKNGNSRWDIIDVVRLTYALRPQGIVWPKDDQGLPTFRLEKLTEANGIEHLSAHDAMSDVYATIALAKLIKQKQPALYKYAFENKDKRKISEMVDYVNHKPLVHVSSKFPREKGCMALVAPIAEHPNNKNGVICFDLRQDPRSWEALSADQIRNLLYTPSTELPKGMQRPAIKTIHLNKCPVVLPASMLKTIPEERLDEWELDLEKMLGHLEWIRANDGFCRKLAAVLEQEYDFNTVTDPDLMIYSGGFFSAKDKAEMGRIRASSELELAEEAFYFDDARLPEMLFRYKARNFPSTLTEEEQEKWAHYCAYKLFDGKSAYLTVHQYYERISELLSSSETSSTNKLILEDLTYYAESIIPYS